MEKTLLKVAAVAISGAVGVGACKLTYNLLEKAAKALSK